MRLIEPFNEELFQEEGIDGLYKMIEIAGKTCYKSEISIDKDAPYKFVEMLKKNKHTSVLEHATVYLIMEDNKSTLEFYTVNPYSFVVRTNGMLYITTNYRVLYENNLLGDLFYLCNATKYHIKRYTIKCVTNIGVSMQELRHRVMSFSQESTRYCNYSKDRFNKQLTFIKPCWFTYHSASTYTTMDVPSTNDLNNDLEELIKECVLLRSFIRAEKDYLFLIDRGWDTNKAREVLPKGLKTEIVVTATSTQWREFFKLRTSPKAHIQMRFLADDLYTYFTEHGYIAPLIEEV